MIYYIVADDRENTRKSVYGFLQSRIEKEFGPAIGKPYGKVNEVLSAIKEGGKDLHLIVLDMKFRGGVIGGGLKILNHLTQPQRRLVVVYSSQLDRVVSSSGRLLSDEISTHAIPPERIIALSQGPEGLWKGCVSVLSESLK